MPLFHHLTKHRRQVGHDAIHPEVEQTAHLGWIVDGPGMDGETLLVRSFDESFRDHGDSSEYCWRLHGESVTGSATNPMASGHEIEDRPWSQ
jgi:hypothetical protein